MCNLLIFGIFWKASMLYKLHCKDSFHALHWTLKCKLIYVRICWRKIVFIISDKFTRYIKLLGDVWESKKRVCLNCNCCIGRRVFSWCLTHYRSPESEILKKFHNPLFFLGWKFSGAHFRLCILCSWIH